MGQFGYYRILELAKNATKDEIKQAYNRRRKELYPKGEEFSTYAYNNLTEAYEILINEEKRKLYDQDKLNLTFFSFSYSNKKIIDKNKYLTNVSELTCSCLDWKLKRAHYKKNDPRRLCKHLINKFDLVMPEILKLPSFLIPYHYKIIQYRNDRKGFLNYYTNAYFFEDSTLFEINHGENFDIFITNTTIPNCQNKYLHLYRGAFLYGEKTISPNIYNWSSSSCRRDIQVTLSDKSIKAIDYLIEQYNIIIETKVNPCSIFYDEYIEKLEFANKVWEKGYLVREMFKFSSFYNLDKNDDISLKEKKYQIVSYNEFYYFDTTKNLLQEHNSSLTTSKFHKLLVELNFLRKEKNLNKNNWIITNEGLDYGINYAINSIYTHIQIPSWYKISYFDSELLMYKNETRYGLLSLTNALWNKKLFIILLNLVDNYNKRKEFLKQEEQKINIEKKRIIINEAKKEGIVCIHCNSVNLHKKDKRKRKMFTVQRWQCQDCNKLFQIKVEESN